jgi:hypothetical protein
MQFGAYLLLTCVYFTIFDINICLELELPDGYVYNITWVFSYLPSYLPRRNLYPARATRASGSGRYGWLRQDTDFKGRYETTHVIFYISHTWSPSHFPPFTVQWSFSCFHTTLYHRSYLLLTVMNKNSYLYHGTLYLIVGKRLGLLTNGFHILVVDIRGYNHCEFEGDAPMENMFLKRMKSRIFCCKSRNAMCPCHCAWHITFDVLNYVINDVIHICPGQIWISGGQIWILLISAWLRPISNQAFYPYQGQIQTKYVILCISRAPTPTWNPWKPGIASFLSPGLEKNLNLNILPSEPGTWSYSVFLTLTNWFLKISMILINLYCRWNYIFMR